jgi:propionyl-CoA synthetase
MEDENEIAECVALKSTHPLYILCKQISKYFDSNLDTSGTTGEPKGVVRDTGGTVVALDWTLKNVFNISKGDVYFSGSDIGWVVGHSFILYGPLIRGATTIMFEGKPIIPDCGVLWRVVEKY